MAYAGETKNRVPFSSASATANASWPFTLDCRQASSTVLKQSSFNGLPAFMNTSGRNGEGQSFTLGGKRASYFTVLNSGPLAFMGQACQESAWHFMLGNKGRRNFTVLNLAPLVFMSGFSSEGK